ncbi:MAG: hypothetical protein ABIN89_20615 [Chitinophagaceae bacterium]
MEKTLIVCGQSPLLSSHLSFSPIIKYLQERQAKQNGTSEKHLNDLMQKIALTPELTLPIEDLDIVNKNAELIGSMMNLVYPKSKENGIDFYAVAAPLSSSTVYSSSRLPNFFLTGDSNHPFIKDEGRTNFFEAQLEMAYQLILNNFYGLEELHNNTFVHPVVDPASGIEKLLEIDLVAEFIEVKLIGKLPEIDPALLSKLFRQKTNDAFFTEQLPLCLFAFEGVLIIKLRDVTVRESINKIKNTLLVMPCFGDVKSFETIQEQVRKLIEIPDVKICITSRVRKNTQGDKIPVLNQHTFLLQPSYLIEDDSNEWLYIKRIFEERSSFIIQGTSDLLLRQYPFLQSYADGGIKSLIMYPLRSGKELMGVLSIVSETPERIKQYHILKLEQVIPLLELALGKQSEKMDDEVDKIIKEQFTAVQSSVNWKFTETARNFIIQKNNHQECKIESIVFENVYPLYGAIDVRNSSVERSIALQKDLFDQLLLADAIIRKSKRELYLFSLQEISFRIEKYINIASVVLFPGDEMAIQSFLDEEIADLFHHLKIAIPAIQVDIENYFLSLNTSTRKMSRQCTAFEESIAMINNELVKFITHEQIKVQKIYAHYFEYFVTDGVDFNIYIGQSITPGKPFDQFYLKNLKLWQLTTLVKAAQKVRRLQGSMKIPLDTTQLILAHNKPLSISFKKAERKFDVDGAYNMHYEIIKKRIDKIKIMGSSERLTQPGKIAIVFAQNKEAQEYTSYIEFLQNEGLLEGVIEYYDLEDLPGVRGLKALRVSINMEKKEEVYPIHVTNYQLPVTG